jgi:hypothetical protein
MMTDISSEAASTAGASVDSASQTVEVQNQTADTAASNIEPQNNGTLATPQKGAAPVIPANQQATPAPTPTYTPNFKYKAAGQEKEIDPLFQAIIKDAETETKVKDIFSKIDAFDFMKQKTQAMEKEFGSLATDYDAVATTVDKFNKSVAENDLTSAFRLANITKEQVFKWTQQQLRQMDRLSQMSPEERQEYQQLEEARQSKSELEERVQQIQQQYESQAVQARTMQLDMTLSRPEISKFAEAWDQNSGEAGSFRAFVAEEARKVFYEQNIDLSPEQAVAHVMKRFGKFLNVGGTMSAQSPQAIPTAQGQKPVIPHVNGKAASPIKKVAKSLDDLKALAKTL